MLVYRVFPRLEGARPGQPGHPLYIHPDQGTGRWDNPDSYRAMYVAASATGAIGESFAHLSIWSLAMLPAPAIAGAERMLGVYSIDEEANPLLELDDPGALLDRGLRPTDVVIRNRPRTQEIALDAYEEDKWTGLSWWSMHRPQWSLHVLWRLDGLLVEQIEPLPGHPGLHDAGRLLAKQVAADLL